MLAVVIYICSMEKFKEGKEVKYNGKETYIEEIYKDGMCKIANPDWDYDEEGLCVSLDINYDIPYWINVNISELSS